MKEEVGEIKHTAHDWLDKLPDEQVVAIAPVLKSLGELLSLSATKYSGSPAAVPAESSSEKSQPERAVASSYLALEKQLEDALVIDDIQALRDHLASTLSFLRSNRAHLSQWEAHSSAAAPPVTILHASSRVDRLTGLPERLVLEEAITNAITQGEAGLVAAFRVERIRYVNKRFGRTTGDEIILFVAQYLAEKLPKSSLFVRWSGPAFAAMLTGKAASKEASLELRAISRKQLSTSIDLDGRPVMLPVSCSCLVEVLSSASPPEKLFAKMDEFVGAT